MPVSLDVKMGRSGARQILRGNGGGRANFLGQEMSPTCARMLFINELSVCVAHKAPSTDAEVHGQKSETPAVATQWKIFLLRVGAILFLDKRRSNKNISCRFFFIEVYTISGLWTAPQELLCSKLQYTCLQTGLCFVLLAIL